MHLQLNSDQLAAYANLYPQLGDTTDRLPVLAEETNSFIPIQAHQGIYASITPTVSQPHPLFSFIPSSEQLGYYLFAGAALLGSMALAGFVAELSSMAIIASLGYCVSLGGVSQMIIGTTVMGIAFTGAHRFLEMGVDRLERQLFASRHLTDDQPLAFYDWDEFWVRSLFSIGMFGALRGVMSGFARFTGARVPQTVLGKATQWIGSASTECSALTAYGLGEQSFEQYIRNQDVGSIFQPANIGIQLVSNIGIMIGLRGANRLVQPFSHMARNHLTRQMRQSSEPQANQLESIQDQVNRISKISQERHLTSDQWQQLFQLRNQQLHITQTCLEVEARLVSMGLQNNVVYQGMRMEHNQLREIHVAEKIAQVRLATQTRKLTHMELNRMVHLTREQSRISQERSDIMRDLHAVQHPIQTFWQQSIQPFLRRTGPVLSQIAIMPAGAFICTGGAGFFSPQRSSLPPAVRKIYQQTGEAISHLRFNTRPSRVGEVAGLTPEMEAVFRSGQYAIWPQFSTDQIRDMPRRDLVKTFSDIVPENGYAVINGDGSDTMISSTRMFCIFGVGERPSIQTQQQIYDIYRQWYQLDVAFPETGVEMANAMRIYQEQFGRYSIEVKHARNPEDVFYAMSLLSLLPEPLLQSSALRSLSFKTIRSGSGRYGAYHEDIGEVGIVKSNIRFNRHQATGMLLHECGHAMEQLLTPSQRTQLERLHQEMWNENAVFGVTFLGFSRETRIRYQSSFNEWFAENFMHFIVFGNTMRYADQIGHIPLRQRLHNAYVELFPPSYDALPRLGVEAPAPLTQRPSLTLSGVRTQFFQFSQALAQGVFLDVNFPVQEVSMPYNEPIMVMVYGESPPYRITRHADGTIRANMPTRVEPEGVIVGDRLLIRSSEFEGAPTGVITLLPPKPSRAQPVPATTFNPPSLRDTIQDPSPFPPTPPETTSRPPSVSDTLRDMPDIEPCEVPIERIASSPITEVLSSEERGYLQNFLDLVNVEHSKLVPLPMLNKHQQVLLRRNINCLRQLRRGVSDRLHGYETIHINPETGEISQTGALIRIDQEAVGTVMIVRSLDNTPILPQAARVLRHTLLSFNQTVVSTCQVAMQPNLNKINRNPFLSDMIHAFQKLLTNGPSIDLRSSTSR